MGVGLLDHYNIRTDKLDDTVHFYEGVLGMAVGPRPDFPSKGAWLYSEDQPIVHIIDIEGLDETMKTDTGSIDHVAFIATGFDDMKERLDGKSVEFEWRDVPGGEIKQIFIHDPNGVKLELNFLKARGF